MTFIAPARTGFDVAPPFALFRRAAKPRVRARVVDEDGARKAMGIDAMLPVAALPGTSLEHLARIALG